MHAHNVDSSIVETQANIIEKVTKKELNQLAAKHLVPTNMTYIVVGDAPSLTTQLEAKGFNVKTLTIL